MAALASICVSTHTHPLFAARGHVFPKSASSTKMVMIRFPPILVWRNYCKLFCWWQTVRGENTHALYLAHHGGMWRRSLWELLAVFYFFGAGPAFVLALLFVRATFFLSTISADPLLVRKTALTYTVFSHSSHLPSFSHFFLASPLLMQSEMYFSILAFSNTSVAVPLRVWARFFCLPLFLPSQLRAQGYRKWPKMPCAEVALETGGCDAAIFSG